MVGLVILTSRPRLDRDIEPYLGTIAGSRNLMPAYGYDGVGRVD